MRSITLIFGLSVSVNAAYRNLANIGRVKTSKYNAWIEENKYYVLQQLPADWKPLSGALGIAMQMDIIRSNSDADNRIKTCLDLLGKHTGVITDDKQFRRIYVDWVPRNSIQRPNFIPEEVKELMKVRVYQTNDKRLRL